MSSPFPLLSFHLGGMKNGTVFASVANFPRETTVVSQSPCFTLDPGQKYVSLAFNEANIPYRLEAQYRCIHKVVNVAHKDWITDVFLHLTSPLTLKKGKVIQHRNSTFWVSTNCILDGRQRPLRFLLTPEQLGYSTTLKIKLRTTDYNVLFHTLCQNDFRSEQIVCKTVQFAIPHYESRTQFLFFETTWAWAVLWSCGVGVQSQLEDLAEKFESWEARDKIYLTQALLQTARESHGQPWIDVCEAIDRFLENEPVIEQTPPGMYRVFYFTKTPTRSVFKAPELCFGNRILRDYDSSCAVSLTFRDDAMQRISAASWDREALDQMVTDFLRKGLHMLGREFRFLAASGSQLREHGCWLYARDEKGIGAEVIRRQMGDFTEIKCTSKLIARMGQCLSRSEDTVGLCLEDGVRVDVEPDIVGGECPKTKKPYIFSDGIGTISPLLLSEAVEELLAYQKDKEFSMPCAIQVRYGGCKGMLCVDPTLHGKQVKFRESMVKFRSSHERLEIMAIASPMRLFLNRQVITIFEQRGISAEVFLRLQDTMLQKLVASLVDEKKALEVLKSKVHFKNFRTKALQEKGVSLTTEPFFRSLLAAINRRLFDELLNKSRIELPADSSRNMFGVLDETGTLEPGQIFLQISERCDKPGKNPKVIEGAVMVSKMPALNPGDLRCFTAANNPDLRHLKDVIVFPQKGQRPHPDEMSGSDLDGDEYFVTWQPELIIRDNVPAAHFPTTSARVAKNIIGEADMINCIRSYIESGNVGVIANRHLALADDRVSGGVFSEQCVKAAELFSKAVDAPKTGETIRVSKELPSVDWYPDFMGKHTHMKTIMSQNAIGKLYRDCKRVQNITLAANEDGISSVVEADRNLMHEGYQTYLPEARRAAQDYDKKMNQLLRSSGLESEAEAITGHVSQFSEPLQEGEKRNKTEIIKRRVVQLFEETREDFFQEFYALSGSLDKSAKQKQAKAAAWYCVTYEEIATRFLSFAWVIGDVLTQPVDFSPSFPVSPFKTTLGQSIVEYASNPNCNGGILLKVLVKAADQWKGLASKAMSFLASNPATIAVATLLINRFAHWELHSLFVSPEALLLHFVQFWQSLDWLRPTRDEYLQDHKLSAEAMAGYLSLHEDFKAPDAIASAELLLVTLKELLLPCRKTNDDSKFLNPSFFTTRSERLAVILLRAYHLVVNTSRIDSLLGSPAVRGFQLEQLFYVPPAVWNWVVRFEPDARLLLSSWSVEKGQPVELIFSWNTKLQKMNSGCIQVRGTFDAVESVEKALQCLCEKF